MSGCNFNGPEYTGQIPEPSSFYYDGFPFVDRVNVRPVELDHHSGYGKFKILNEPRIALHFLHMIDQDNCIVLEINQVKKAE